MLSLNVVALISGGKDSFFSILHCLEHGHKVIALANLHPVMQDGISVEDLDSFMYQTVGHAIVPLYEQALGLPLFRKAINGDAVIQSKTYDPTIVLNSQQLDETEALIPLLQQVMHAHPEVNAVSSGAILSDYQRTRIESVALRLGLVPLSYLWQYPRIVTRSPVSLLEDMRAAGQESRIIKVASGGLDSSNLWDDVSDSKTMHRLLKATQLYGSSDDGAALGEGGEYETLAISGPSPLWKGRIEIKEHDRHNVPGEAGSASLRFSHATVQTGGGSALTSLPQPTLLDDHFRSVFDSLEESMSVVEAQPLEQDRISTFGTSVAANDSTVLLGPYTAQGIDAAEQMKQIMAKIRVALKEIDHDMSDIAYTSIILRDMVDFQPMNAVYATAFDKPNPPARATLACGSILSKECRLSVSVSSVKTDPHQRQGLHVQSISYWAPANIGPYSQAITVSRTAESDSTVTYIAGQIPLIPATMELDVLLSNGDSTKFLHQAVLSLQHLHRIARAMNVQHWQHAIAFISASDNHLLSTRAATARRVWSEAHKPAPVDTADSEDEDFDVWFHQHPAKRAFLARGNDPSSGSSNLISGSPPELVVIHVDSLPRNADIEWVAFGSNSQDSKYEVKHYRHLVNLFASRMV